MLYLYSFYMLTCAFLFLDIQMLGVLIHVDYVWITIYRYTLKWFEFKSLFLEYNIFFKGLSFVYLGLFMFYFHLEQLTFSARFVCVNFEIFMFYFHLWVECDVYINYSKIALITWTMLTLFKWLKINFFYWDHSPRDKSPGLNSFVFV